MYRNRELPPAAAMPALLSVMLLAAPASAWAYIGPGAGLSAIGSVLALLLAVLLAVVGFVWYPVKRLLARRRAGDARIESSEAPMAAEADAEDAKPSAGGLAGDA